MSSSQPRPTARQRRILRSVRVYGKVLFAFWIVGGASLLIGGIARGDGSSIAVGALVLFVLAPISLVKNLGITGDRGPAKPDPKLIVPARKTEPSNDERLRSVQAWLAERGTYRRGAQ